MAGYVSLFDELGVTPDASDADVKIAYERKKVEAEVSGSAVNNCLAYAYKVLRTQEGRQLYVESLVHCKERIPIEVLPEKSDRYRACWAFAGIRYWPDPKRTGLFHLRRSDQEEPSFVHAGPPPQPVVWSAARAIWGFLTLRPFVGASRDEKVGLLVFYALVIAAIAYGVDWAGTRAGAWREARLKASVVEHLATVENAMSELRAGSERFASEYRSVIGCDPGETDPTPEINRLIQRDTSVLRAWREINDNHITMRELGEAGTSISVIQGRVANSVYRHEDDAELVRLIEWNRKQADTLRSLNHRLDNIRSLLRISELHESSRKRESP